MLIVGIKCCLGRVMLLWSLRQSMTLFFSTVLVPSCRSAWYCKDSCRFLNTPWQNLHGFAKIHADSCRSGGVMCKDSCRFLADLRVIAKIHADSYRSAWFCKDSCRFLQIPADLHGVCKDSCRFLEILQIWCCSQFCKGSCRFLQICMVLQRFMQIYAEYAILNI